MEPDNITGNPTATELGDGVRVMFVGRTKLAEAVTALFGIVNWQGLLDGPPEHDAPVSVQLEKR